MNRDGNLRLRNKALHKTGINDELLNPGYAKRGFLPLQDPLSAFPAGSPYGLLDEVGRRLPDLLLDKQFRSYVKSLKIPVWRSLGSNSTLPELRLYYLRLGFLASAYINQVGLEPCHTLPANIAIPLVKVCRLLKRPPILSYDGYALYNWRRLQQDQPIQLGNIDTLQNFVSLYDEHWFILVHVEIEAIAAAILAAIARIYSAQTTAANADYSAELWQIAAAVERQVEVLKRIPEKMDPALYYKTFRPYIRFFEHVVFAGVARQAINFRGETGAQSSIIPVLVAFLKIPHQSSILTEHLAAMRSYMPEPHRRYLQQVSAMPNIRNKADKNAFNAILNKLIEFRTVHFAWADEYIHRHVKDPRGTGGTPYMKWLQQLIDETEAYKI